MGQELPGPQDGAIRLPLDIFVSSPVPEGMQVSVKDAKSGLTYMGTSLGQGQLGARDCTRIRITGLKPPEGAGLPQSGKEEPNGAKGQAGQAG